MHKSFIFIPNKTAKYWHFLVVNFVNIFIITSSFKDVGDYWDKKQHQSPSLLGPATKTQRWNFQIFSVYGREWKLLIYNGFFWMHIQNHTNALGENYNENINALKKKSIINKILWNANKLKIKMHCTLKCINDWNALHRKLTEKTEALNIKYI